MHAEYLLTNGWSWDFEHCTPCDPPQEASHITPEGKQTAEGALPQPGYVVRLVREPTPNPSLMRFVDFPWAKEWGTIGDVAEVIETLNPQDVAVAVRFTPSHLTLWWPLSCIEVVKGVDK